MKKSYLLPVILPCNLSVALSTAKKDLNLQKEEIHPFQWKREITSKYVKCIVDNKYYVEKESPRGQEAIYDFFNAP